MTSFAIIGLGKMGGNMARRLARGGLRPVLFDQDAALTAALASELGCVAAASPTAAVAHLTGPRVVWLMLPSGQVTEDMIAQVSLQLQSCDVLVDGANSFYKDAIRRAANLKTRGVEFADAGVSGGVHGLANGYCLMVGGSDAALRQLRPYLEVLAPKPRHRLAARRPGRGGALREDGPQRHRVRDDAGLRRRIRHAGG